MKKTLIMLAALILIAGGCATWSTYTSDDNSDYEPDSVQGSGGYYSDNQNSGTVHHARPKPGIHKPVHHPKPKPVVHNPVHHPKPKPAVHKPIHHPNPKPAVHKPVHHPKPRPTHTVDKPQTRPKQDNHTGKADRPSAKPKNRNTR